LFPQNGKEADMAYQSGIPTPTCAEFAAKKKKNPDYPDRRPRPKHPDTGQLKKDLGDWGKAWRNWLDAYARTVSDVIDKAESPKTVFDAVVEEFAKHGEEASVSACALLQRIRDLPAAHAAEEVPVETSSPPPPPPFGSRPRED
jgi:hypothetical protein